MQPEKKKAYYDCIDCTISNMFNIFNEDYRIVFINCFGFEYLKKQHFLDDIIASSLVPIHEIINKYTNLNYHIDFICKDKLEDYIVNSLKDKPCISINMDAYYLHWNPYYRINHRPHNILVHSYNRNNKELVVYDTFLKPGQLMLNYKDLEEGYKFSFYLEQKDNKREINYYFLFDCLKEAINETSTERKSKLEVFLENLLHFEYTDYDVKTIDSTDFIISFSNFIWSRYKAIDYLNLISEKTYINVNNIIVEIQKCIKLWEKLRNLIVKDIILKSNICEKQITQLSQEVIYHEVRTVELINNE